MNLIMLQYAVQHKLKDQNRLDLNINKFFFQEAVKDIWH